MTSRALFYKGMLQDLRHRIWTIALSCLGSFMAMPVFYLLMKQEWDRRIEYWYPESNWTVDEYKIEAVIKFFEQYMTVTCGIILVVGALIVGIFGFRYVFSKKMVDLYHSIPITRKQLFFIHYVNGFNIWFLPMALGALICALMELSFIGNFGLWLSTLPSLLVTIGNLVLAFLLIYHLAIVAVMLSGNILNTLINGTIMSFMVLALYSMFEVFANTYFSTFYSFYGKNVLNLFWTSPIGGAIYQLVMRCTEWNGFSFIMNMVMAVVLLAAGFVLYMVRPSELAEQGMKIKWVQVIFKTAVTILAGMAGWIFFGYLTDTESIGWLLFGMIFGSVLAYGILDIIFQMDFKAFFKHKLQMVLTTLAGVLIGFTFLFDWTGFDTYVPAQDNIADMGIYINSLGYYGHYDAFEGCLSVENRIKEMKYTDVDVIYSFLANAADRGDQYPTNGRSCDTYVRVTEKSGKTYYRRYRVWEEDAELLLPILRDESYIKANVQMPQVIIDNIQVDEKNGFVSLENINNSNNIVDKEQAQEILRAYNEDLLENPDAYIFQEEEVFAQMNFRLYGENYYYMHLDFYESMEHVKAVLKKYGYDEFLDNVKTENIENIKLMVWTDKEQSLEGVFGIGEEAKTNSEPVTIVDEVTIPGAVEISEDNGYQEFLFSARFDKQDDIKELLDVITCITPDNRSVFGPEYCGADVILTYVNGSSRYVSIKKGVLPEKFLHDFEPAEEYYY